MQISYFETTAARINFVLCRKVFFSFLNKLKGEIKLFGNFWTVFLGKLNQDFARAFSQFFSPPFYGNFKLPTNENRELVTNFFPWNYYNLLPSRSNKSRISFLK